MARENKFIQKFEAQFMQTQCYMLENMYYGLFKFIKPIERIHH